MINKEEKNVKVYPPSEYLSRNDVIERLLAEKGILLQGWQKMEILPARKGKTNGHFAGSEPKNPYRVRIRPTKAFNDLVNRLMQERGITLE